MFIHLHFSRASLFSVVHQLIDQEYVYWLILQIENVKNHFDEIERLTAENFRTSLTGDMTIWLTMGTSLWW
jgi:hypothetical protein